MQSKISAGVLISLALSGTACQPDTITEARDQLARGEARTISLSVPITADTFTIARFLEDQDTATTSTGLIGIPIDSQAVQVAVGEELAFDGLSFDAFTFGYDQMLATNAESVTVNVVAPAPPARSTPFGAPPANGIGFQTDNGSAVQSATIGSGSLIRRVSNGTVCAGDVTVSLVDSLNNQVIPDLDLTIGPSQTFVDTVPMAGRTMVGFVVVNAAAVPDIVFPPCVPSSGETVSVQAVFEPMTLASVSLANVIEPFTANYGALASESRVQAVDTIVVNSGSFAITVAYKLPLKLDFDIQLAGILSNGVARDTSFTVPAASGNGTPDSTTVVFDLAGATIVPSEVVATVNGTVTTDPGAVATITNALVANAVEVTASGNLEVETLIGSLDPAQTPELTVVVEDFVQVSSADFDFGDFEDAIKDATINNAEADLSVTNTSGVPLVLQTFVLSVARIDPLTGQPAVDASGDFILETDGTGTPLGVLVADPGSSVLAIPRGGSSNVTLELDVVGDRIVKLALDGIDVAMVATGTAVAGDASPSRIDRTDIIDFGINVVIGLDMSLPPTGISFQIDGIESGAEFTDADADAVVEHLVRAEMTSTVLNGTPFALMVEVAYVEGDRGADFDVFGAADRIEVTPVTVAAPTVNAAGLVTTPTSSDVSLILTGDEIRQLLGDFVSSSIRITLLPGVGGGGRGAVRPTDEVMFSAGATIEIDQGGN